MNNSSAMFTTNLPIGYQTEVRENFSIDPRYLGCYTDPLRSRKITVWMKPEGGLFARIYDLTSAGEIFKRQDNLPLVGIPKELTNETDVQRLVSFFNVTHLLPERGSDGVCNRVSVHVSGKGGGNEIIPFQPGLALGSVIKGDALEKMQKYAEAEAQIASLEERMRSLENQIEAFESKIQLRTEAQRNKYQNLASDPLIAAWNKQIAALKDEIPVIGKQIIKKKTKQLEEENLEFGNFPQGVVSPVDMTNSLVEMQVRGFENMNFQSNFIDKRTSKSEIYDRLTNSVSMGFWNMNDHVAAEKKGRGGKCDYVAQRVHKILKTDKSEGVLVINAFVTSRYVRSITKLIFDDARLKQILSVMKTSDPKNDSDAKKLKKFGITCPPEGEKKIYVLSEAVLGGSFTALVTMFRTDEASDTQSREQHPDAGTNRVAVGQDGRGDSGGGNATATYHGRQVHGQQGNQEADGTAATEATTSRSSGNIQVNIEFISQGVLPEFSTKIVEREIMKHLDLNPAKYQLSKKDQAYAETMTRDDQGQREAVIRHRIKMENAEVALLNTYRGLTAEKEKQNIHTLESVMDAYDNFAEKISSEKECGVPVGFNYIVLTQSQIEEILKMPHTHSPGTVPGQSGQATGNATSSQTVGSGSNSSGSTQPSVSGAPASSSTGGNRPATPSATGGSSTGTHSTPPGGQSGEGGPTNINNNNNVTPPATSSQEAATSSGNK